MINRAILLILIVSFVFSYEKDGNILVLNETDFPQVINDNQFIFIKFYA